MPHRPPTKLLSRRDIRRTFRLREDEDARYRAQAQRLGEDDSEWTRRTLAIGASVRESMPEWKATVA